MDTSILVQNVKKYCNMKGVTPAEAFRESGVDKNFISNMVNRNSIPSVEKVQTLAVYLGVTTSDLLGEEMKLWERDETDPAYRELRYIIDNASHQDRVRFLQTLKMYIDFWADAKGPQKKKQPRKSEAVEGEQLFEACTPVKAGTYKCVGCGRDYTVIEEDGEQLRPCAVCGEVYWSKIK